MIGLLFKRDAVRNRDSNPSSPSLTSSILLSRQSELLKHLVDPPFGMAIHWVHNRAHQFKELAGLFSNPLKVSTSTDPANSLNWSLLYFYQQSTAGFDMGLHQAMHALSTANSSWLSHDSGFDSPNMGHWITTVQKDQEWPTGEIHTLQWTMCLFNVNCVCSSLFQIGTRLTCSACYVRFPQRTLVWTVFSSHLLHSMKSRLFN